VRRNDEVAPERTSLTRASAGPAARRPAVDPYYYSDDPEERSDITIRELAEKQRKDIESNGPDCEPELERRIRAAMYDDGELQITTLSDGTLGPSAQPDVLHGAALYRITGGSGRFDGASGLITSNFLLHPATGEFEKRQVTVLFLS
jgi:hypothetical protein